MPHLGSGVSDNYRETEERRCGNYTFEYRRTELAWTRHWIELPEGIRGKQVELHFDAVSRIAEVYVNGTYIGGNVGMFGYFGFDITEYMQPGRNLLAVNVKVRQSERSAYADKIVARAVSVDITNDMLRSLPHAMFAGIEGDVWGSSGGN